jgi:hypothetical protein
MGPMVRALWILLRGKWKPSVDWHGRGMMGLGFTRPTVADEWRKA